MLGVYYVCTGGRWCLLFLELQCICCDARSVKLGWNEDGVIHGIAGRVPMESLLICDN